MDTDLDELRSLPGIGPARARALARLGVESVRDLLLLAPRRIEMSGRRCTLAQAARAPGQRVIVRARVVSVRFFRRGRRRSTLTARLRDASGELDAQWYHQPWLRERVRVGEDLELEGEVRGGARPTLVSPRIGSEQRPLSAGGGLVPVYPLSEGLGQERLRGWIAIALERLDDLVREPLPAQVLAAHNLPPLPEALRELHRPSDPVRVARARRRRLLEDLLALQGRVMARSRASREGRARPLVVSDEDFAHLLAGFPFVPTAGQRRVAGEIRADLARRTPMRRLLQGDVGSGKTMIGLLAARIAARAGAQAAFLAPTELLAEQHFQGASELVGDGLRLALLVGSLRAAERRRVLAGLAAGKVDLVFGTHALFSRDVRYRNLALAVIDEQQRFGVAQRARLVAKGLAGADGQSGEVHALLMTATPIPRTLALSLYGDLDVSVLREKPPGRGRVRTRWLRRGEGERLRALLVERLEAGERVFWVAPRVAAEEEDCGEQGASVASAERAFARLARSPLSAFGVELVHGRLPAEERVRRVARFRCGDARILVATTVIEVGVDVPEATVLVVEGAERFGLAQLHQLRGRVGRGGRDGWCLLYGAASAAERLRLLERTDDGFEIARADLERRGMGELLGLRQAGEVLRAGAGPLAAVAEEPVTDLLLLARDLVRTDSALAAHYGGGEEVALVP